MILKILISFVFVKLFEENSLILFKLCRIQVLLFYCCSYFIFLQNCIKRCSLQILFVDLFSILSFHLFFFNKNIVGRGFMNTIGVFIASKVYILLGVCRGEIALQNPIAEKLLCASYSRN